MKAVGRTARRFLLFAAAVILGAYAIFALAPVLLSLAPATTSDSGTMTGILTILGTSAGYVAVVLGREAIRGDRDLLGVPLSRTVLRGFGVGWIAGVVVAAGLALIRSTLIGGALAGGLAGVVTGAIGLVVAQLILAIPGLAALSLTRRMAAHSVPRIRAADESAQSGR